MALHRFVFTFLLCALTLAHATADSPAPQKPAAEYSTEAFVVEKIHESYRFESDGTGRKVATMRIHVQSDAGVKGFGQIRFGYNAANDRMEKALAAGLRAVKLAQSFPDDTPIAILRRGKLSCQPDAGCTMLLMLPGDVKSVD